jgi:predicted ArsR family transcriptional regulator
MVEDSTRELILDYLFQHSPVSARELGSRLGLKPAAVRYHLRSLIQAGQVDPVQPGEANHPPPGRPGRLFRLSSRSRPDNLDILTKALLGLLMASPATVDQDHLLLELAKRISEAALYDYTKIQGKYKEPGPEKIPSTEFSPAHGLPARLNAALVNLNRMNYAATWEARRTGPQIIFHNCPYASVWRSFPALCEMDTRLLEKMMSAPVVRQRIIDPDNPQARTCLFQVRHEK